VGEAGLKVIDSIYPDNIDRTGNKSLSKVTLTAPKRTILHQRRSAIVLAVNTPKLLNEAIKTKGIVELAPQVGDFVGVGEPLVLLHAGAASIADQTLEGCIIFGSERTLEQDPLFAFRILVDIASKALSPAINDPTTAVLAIDQLHRLLRRAGRRDLRTDYLLDPNGEVRVVLRRPNWEDFVELAFTEIRFYGAANIQIPRRVRAMILNLANTLPPERQPALRQELDLLDRMLEKFYALPEDLALARVPDTQGLGGATHAIGAS